jgi:hypothetical protein
MPTLANTTRTCNFADHVGPRELPFTSEHYYIRPDGTADYWCRDCVRTYNRSRAGAVTGRKFGVEIEFIGSNYELAQQMERLGLNVNMPGYTHRIVAGQWKIVTDASVYNGYELVSPPLKGARGLADLKKACEALAAAGCSVNSTCGLHVHHDVSDLNVAAFGRLFRAWHNNQPNTDMLVARSRRNGRWSQSLREVEVARVETLPSVDRSVAANHFRYTDRYRSLNVACFARYGTVEVRQHQGTINFKKIAAWIAFGQAFVTLAKSNATVDRAPDTDTLLDRLVADGKLKGATATYLKRRAAHFSGHRAVA